MGANFVPGCNSPAGYSTWTHTFRVTGFATPKTSPGRHSESVQANAQEDSSVAEKICWTRHESADGVSCGEQEWSGVTVVEDSSSTKKLLSQKRQQRRISLFVWLSVTLNMISNRVGAEAGNTTYRPPPAGVVYPGRDRQLTLLNSSTDSAWAIHARHRNHFEILTPKPGESFWINDTFSVNSNCSAFVTDNKPLCVPKSLYLITACKNIVRYITTSSINPMYFWFSPLAYQWSWQTCLAKSIAQEVLKWDWQHTQSSPGQGCHIPGYDSWQCWVLARPTRCWQSAHPTSKA